MGVSRVKALQPVDLLLRVWPPMLATAATAAEVGPGHRLEVKYDGFRALAGLSGGRVALQSRNGLDLSARFPAVARALAGARLGQVVLDGEVVAGGGGGRFQALQGGGEVRFVVFDLLWSGDQDLRPLPLLRRQEALRDVLGRVLSKAPVLALAEELPGPLEAALARVREEGWEGLLAKLPGAPYEGRRSRSWLKVKVLAGQELAIVGYTPISSGARAIGALLVAVAEEGRFVYAGKVGTGFDDRTRRELLARLEPGRVAAPSAAGAPRLRDARWVKPELVAQVAFSEWTADGRLRHPSFQGLREDRRPEDAVREPGPSLPLGSRPTSCYPRGRGAGPA